MSAIQLKPGVWSVGILNPALRVFDIVMESKFGTSYNAYLLTGEKNVLIETVHADYFDIYLENIQAVLPLESIDYLIMNHTEPDHSGSVSLLLEKCPNLTVICSAAAKKYLGSIANQDFACQVVKDGATLDMGDKELKFISAPLLHWPDSMFTWDATTGTLFTCDFLGCHFCEPTMQDTGILPVYQSAYQQELTTYYNCIFGPFASAVLAGLDKMPAETSLVCPSHGPVLTQTIAAAKDQYRQWATPTPKTGPTAAVLFCSAYGYTKDLAQAAATALEESGFAVTCTDLTYTHVDAALVNSVDVLLLGAPTINRNAPEGIWGAVHAVDAINTRGKSAGAFGSYGWSGEATDMIQAQLTQLKFKTPEAPFKVIFKPTAEDLTNVATYAKEVAALAKI